MRRKTKTTRAPHPPAVVRTTESRDTLCSVSPAGEGKQPMLVVPLASVGADSVQCRPEGPEARFTSVEPARQPDNGAEVTMVSSLCSQSHLILSRCASQVDDALYNHFGAGSREFQVMRRPASAPRERRLSPGKSTRSNPMRGAEISIVPYTSPHPAGSSGRAVRRWIA